VLPWTPGNTVFESVWLTVLSFEALMFTIAIAFILLAMAKERAELCHKTAALIDPLTGIANRRAFLDKLDAISRRQGAAARPVAMLVADLDNFKSINDKHGHAVGDSALRIFADVVGAKLGPCDLVGRLGGEEFAILLHDAGREKALATGERIRLAFENAAAIVDGRPVHGTVSIGMVTAEAGLFDAPALLVRADEALYCAKERGRNRVETAQPLLASERPRGLRAPARAATQGAA
jgi:diguanylate cyclase (GGDEF)-like protein